MGKEFTSVVAPGIPDAKKRRAEEVLLGALLREPFDLHNHIGRLSERALSNAGADLAPAFQVILDQYKKHGQYSPVTIEAVTGRDVSRYASEFVEVNLEWAITEWEYEYKRWAVASALSHGVYQFSSGEKQGFEIKAFVDQEIDRLGAIGDIANSKGHERFLEWAADKIEGNEKIYPTSSAINELNTLVKSFRPGELWIIGARPGMGKTQFAANLASSFYDNGASGLFISLEMTAESIYRRLMGVRHGINPEADWSTLDRSELWRAATETAEMKERLTVIDDVYGISEIESAVIAASYKSKVDFVFVDYLQLVMASGKHGNRESEIGSIADALMRLSKKAGCPVIALAQLSRANEARGGSKRPLLSDLRESGRIEQSAYGVIFLYRAEYYGITEDESGQSTAGTGELIVAKHRNGAVGTARSSFGFIRGYRNIDSVSPHMRQNLPPVDFTIPQSARPQADEDIPF